MSVSRRGLFSKFLRPLQAGSKKAASVVTGAADEYALESGAPPYPGSLVGPEATNRVAVIQGRYCLAYQGSFCSVCYERCPVPNALQLNEGMPRVVLEVCTGCGVCHDVCPAPENAVLITERRPGFGA
jgi:Pyruvate/2-oxoacid:ferredoxin oxidoreductase delta subunit